MFFQTKRASYSLSKYRAFFENTYTYSSFYCNHWCFRWWKKILYFKLFPMILYDSKHMNSCFSNSASNNIFFFIKDRYKVRSKLRNTNDILNVTAFMLMSDLTGSSGQVLKPVSEVIVLESPYVTITQVSLVLHGGYSDVKISAQTSYFFNKTKNSWTFLSRFSSLN